MAEKTPIGDLLRRHRLFAGLSQEALAERAGLSVDAIRALERGRRHTPRPDTLAMLATALTLDDADRIALITVATGTEAPMMVPGRSNHAIPPSPPAPPGDLIGREHALQKVVEILRAGDRRLVTLTGPGGVGKTRLALAVAQHLRDDYPEGLSFVDLAPLRDPALVATAITDTLGVRAAGAAGAWDILRTHLGTRRILLILDNFEQVIEAAPPLAETLAMCPGIVALVTSRMALRLRAEQQFRVPPLTGGAAVRLFVTRARAMPSEFQIDDTSIGTIAEICARLDRLPLAIELAAARVAVLPPVELLARLDNGLRLLTNGARDLPARQRTLRGVIAWSYDLLDAEEQRLFRLFGAFAGGATLAAITTVAREEGEDDFAVLDRITALVDASLLSQTAGADGTARFTTLETIGALARQLLEASSDADAAHRVHAAHYRALAEQAEPHFRGPDEAAWIAKIEIEHDNLRAALAWCEEADAEVGLSLAASLWEFWWVRGYMDEGRGWLDRLLAQATAPVLARAKALLGAGFLAAQQGDREAAAKHFDAGLAVSRARDDDQLTARLLQERGILFMYSSDYATARSLIGEAVTLCRTTGAFEELEAALLNLARLLRHQGRYAEARNSSMKPFSTPKLGSRHGRSLRSRRCAETSRATRETS